MFSRATLCVELSIMLVSASVGQTQEQERVYAGEGGMMFHPILLEKTADFEDVVTRVLDAMSNSADETRRAQAAGWKIYRATEPGPPEQTSVLYVFVIDPTVTEANYSIGELLRQELPLEAQELWEKFAASYAYSPSLLNLTLVADFTETELLPTAPEVP